MISLLIPKVLHFIISTLLFKDLILIKCRFPLGKVPHQLFIPQSEKNNLRTSFIKQYRGWIQGSWETCDPWNKGLRGFDTKLHLSPGFSWIQLHYICFKDSSSSKWNVFLGKLSFQKPGQLSNICPWNWGWAEGMNYTVLPLFLTWHPLHSFASL